MLYQSLKPVVRIALAWYYRSITVAGAERVPDDGPVFLAVNHPNALVDALVVASCVERRVRFTAKATIFANPLLAAFLTRAGVVPLRRAADEHHGNEGSRGDKAADSASDSKVDPARNAVSFGAVADALAEGSAIVIFPEGKSHDEPKLAPLRTGLARMVRMAHDERGVRGIRIVPVGLLFERKEEPRTRVLVQIGEPIDVDCFEDGAASVAALTAEVSARLSAVTTNFDTTDDAARIGLVGETLGALLEPIRELSDDIVPLASTLALVRRIDRAERVLRSRESLALHPEIGNRICQFELRLLGFRDRLNAEGVDMHNVALETGVAPAAWFVVREAAIATLLLPFVLWGRLTHYLPITLTRAIASRGVRNRDEPAMRALVIGLLLVLAAYAALTTLVALLAGGWWALLFLVSLVPSATADFRYGDRLHRARARARTFFRFRRNPSLQHELLAEAAWLREEAGALESFAAATVTASVAD